MRRKAVKQWFFLSLLIISILWFVLISICVLNFSGHGVSLRSNTNIRTRTSVNLMNSNSAMMRGSKVGVLYDNDTKRYQLLKAMWPPKAKPGDPGYDGAGVSINRSLLTEREKIIYDNGFTNFVANMLASEKIPMRRNITLNMPECKNISYDTATLPRAGIVIVFTEEMWSSLMRTVFSILDAGPEDLISEIILVDDASEKDHLGKPLDDYIKIFAGKVKLVRLRERKGLIVARNIGFQHVTGEVVIFLDSHCEVANGWLEPLLHRIKQDDTVLAIPLLDVLKFDTFEYQFINNRESSICGFELGMEIMWMPMPQVDGIKRKSLTDPVPTPAHSGCCFATSKKNFQRVGMYDPGLAIWGCENLELSFKTWMCGGRIEMIPCSHIAHLFRTGSPYKWIDMSTYQRNCLRVAEVWMDQYKVFFNNHVLNSQTKIDIGDISERKALREKLKCRSFDWYVKEIYPDLYLPINTTAIGSISNVLYQSVCMQIPFRRNEIQIPTATNCQPHRDTQYFYLTKEKQIRRFSHCLSYNKVQNHFVSNECKHSQGTWTYTQDNLIMLDDTDLCITMLNQSSIIMRTCNSSDTNQQWSWPRKSIILS